MNSLPMKEEYDVIVIGGGPAGLMAAGTAARKFGKVLLIEKNQSLGRKLLMTGGGRCNITNANFDIRSFLSHFRDNGKFLFSTFSQFGVQDTFDFFEGLDLPLITENHNRVFPKSEKSHDVLSTLEKYCRDFNVEIKTGEEVIELIQDQKSKTPGKEKAGSKIVAVKTNSAIYYGKNFILTTGGTSHPETGSTGEGLNWLTNLGHKVKDPTPDIVPLKVKDKWVSKISGVSIDDAKIQFLINGQKAFHKQGRILFTHFGLSGPMILNLAYKVKDLLYAGKVEAKIILEPGLNIGEQEKKIIEIFEKFKNKDLKNILKEILPNGLEIIFPELLPDFDWTKKVHSITKEERKEIVNLMKNITVEIEGLMGMDKAVVSDGGVSLEEIDTKTMRSKIIDNLYLAGDILDVNRPSGGYSLQLCWTTGFVAGQVNN